MSKAARVCLCKFKHHQTSHRLNTDQFLQSVVHLHPTTNTPVCLCKHGLHRQTGVKICACKARFRHLLTKVCTLRRISLVTSHVSHPYKSTDFTQALKILILVSFHINVDSHTFLNLYIWLYVLYAFVSFCKLCIFIVMFMYS